MQRWLASVPLMFLACGGGDSLGVGPRDASGVDGGMTGDDASAGSDASMADSGTDGGTSADSAADASPQGPLVAFASGYGANIFTYAVGSNGALTQSSMRASFGASPSFLAVNPGATLLFAISEATAGRVGAYSIGASGALTFLNDQSTTGNGPAHVATDRTGKWVFVANYGDGTVAVLPVQTGGMLGAASDSKTVGTNAHMIVSDATNKFVFVPCKGSQYVAQFTFDAVMGKLTPNAVATIASAGGAGPRHIAFHPDGAHAFVINENNSTMTSYTLDTNTGQLATIESKSTLPAGFTGTNTGAEVWVHPNGKWVLGSNRGHDSIVVFAIDTAGHMTLKGHTKTGGTTPRDFTIDPSGAFVYVADQGSNDLRVFAFDANAGTLTAMGAPVTQTSPSFIGIVRLP